jgi:molybdate transport system substrate-binding protein
VTDSLLTAISSMATRSLLGELCEAHLRAGGVPVRLESVGGVDAARRVDSGEAFDLVVLAADAIDALASSGRVLADSRCVLAESSVAIAVRGGAARPDVGSEAALRETVLAAGRIGVSTGPSGVALLKLFERWGVMDALRDRIVQARPGQQVAALLARGDVALGFQQLSELQDEPGIALLGPMPPGLEIATRFVGAVAAASAQPAAARAALAFFGAPERAEIRRRLGMA